MAAICLRATWSMGNVKDRCMHYEKAGDDFFGRSVTGITSLSQKFAASSIYFYPHAVDDGKSFETIDCCVETMINSSFIEK